MTLQHVIVDIQHALKQLDGAESSGPITDFKRQRQEGARMLLKGAVQRLLEETRNNPDAHRLAQQLSTAPVSEMSTHLDKLAELVAASPKPVSSRQRITVPTLPADIRDEVIADVNEIEKCMSAECYRSATILCGRVMETALHRKYFEATGNDLLEKAPGIGLGSLIAKLNEKGVQLDPGLPNQIHLINQVRIFSVHTKKQPFSPSRAQAEAIVLYTLDILTKLFRPA